MNSHFYSHFKKIFFFCVLLFLIGVINVDAWGWSDSNADKEKKKKPVPINPDGILLSKETVQNIVDKVVHAEKPQNEAQDADSTTAEVSSDGETAVEKEKHEVQDADSTTAKVLSNGGTNIQNEKFELQGVESTTAEVPTDGETNVQKEKNNKVDGAGESIQQLKQSKEPGMNSNLGSVDKACHIQDVGPIMNFETWKPTESFLLCSALDLRFSSFDDEMIMKLAESIATHKNLVSVRMSSETPKISKAGWTALSKSIAVNQNVKIFAVTENSQIDALSVGVITRELLGVKNAVEELDFTGTALRNEGAGEIAESLAKGIPGVKILTLSRNQIRARGGVQIGQAIQRHPTLEKLNLDNNIMGDNPVIQLSKKLQTSKGPKIKHLNLSEMNLSAKSMEELAKAIAFSTNLESINLEGNFRISPTGAKILANGLKKNRSLKKIVARYCDLGDDGAYDFITALLKHGNIEYLDIMWNSISNKGVEAIATFLRVNRKLKYLNIAKNNIDSNGFSKIAGSIQNNFVIQEIVYSNNAVRSDSRLDGLLARNNRRNTGKV
jgi:hypothetical protein